MTTIHIVDHGDGWFTVGFRHVNGCGSWTACRFHEISAEIAKLRDAA